MNKDKYVKIDIRRKESIIKYIKDNFERELAKELNLERVSAPLIVKANSGINDDLSGVERKVMFDTLNNDDVEVVMSLAKWKRVALSRYNYLPYEGLYADMNAIRRDDLMDNIHSLYVDQWDYEKIILDSDRKISYLKRIVNKIVKVLVKVNKKTNQKYPELFYEVNKKCFFITAEKLLEMYPDISPKEREYRITKEKKTVFIIGIGKKLKNKTIHDFRAPDYDDWNLNGDLIIYNEVLDIALEISSMGIRVDSKSLLKQLKISNTLDRLKYQYHQDVINNSLPLTIGGGIGQSRICLLLMQQAHIGEVQASYWCENEIQKCKELGIELL